MRALRNFCVPCGDLTAKFAIDYVKDAKKTDKIFASDQKNIYTFVVHNKKYKIMEKATDTPPDKPLRFTDRTGGAA